MTVWYAPNVIESKPVNSLLVPSSWRSYAADIYNSPLEAPRYMIDLEQGASIAFFGGSRRSHLSRYGKAQ